MDIAYGTKYTPPTHPPIVEIAKLVRADIKASVKSGELPVAKYSVTISKYSMGQSLRIRVSGVEGVRVYNPDRLRFERENPHAYCSLNRYSDEIQAAVQKLNEIHGAYNFDGSDRMTDYSHVRFHGFADIVHDEAVRLAEMNEVA